MGLNENLALWKELMIRNPKQMKCIDCGHFSFNFGNEVCMICGGRLLNFSEVKK